MGRGSSKISGNGGGGGVRPMLPGGLPVQDDPVLAGLNFDIPSSNQILYAIRASDIKVGDSLQDLVFSADGTNKKHGMWTFHPEGQDTFKAETFTDIPVTSVKVTAKTVKVTGTWDKAMTMHNPKPSDWGKDLITITKTFKTDDVVRRRVKY